jgi:hypothetical protein
MGLGAVSGSGLAAAPYSCFPVLYLPFLVPVRMYVMNKCFAFRLRGIKGKRHWVIHSLPQMEPSLRFLGLWEEAFGSQPKDSILGSPTQ